MPIKHLIAVAALALATQPAQAVTDVFATFLDAGSVGSGSPIVTLNVPSGKYAIFAKLGLDQDDSTKVVTVVCKLQAGLDFDQDHIRSHPVVPKISTTPPSHFRWSTVFDQALTTRSPYLAHSRRRRAYSSHSDLPKLLRSGLMEFCATG